MTGSTFAEHFLLTSDTSEVVVDILVESGGIDLLSVKIL